MAHVSTPVFVDGIQTSNWTTIAKGAAPTFYVIDLLSANLGYGSHLTLNVGRLGTTALANPAVFSVYRVQTNTNGTVRLGSIDVFWQQFTQTAAPTQYTLATSNVAGINTLTTSAYTQSTITNAIGTWLYLNDTTNNAGNAQEMLQAASSPSTTSIYVRNPTIFNHAATAVSVFDTGDVWGLDLPGGGYYYLGVDYSQAATGSSISFNANMTLFQANTTT